MNIKQILESKEAIEELVGMILPINVAIKVSKVQKECNDALAVYEEMRKALFEKYGEEVDEQLTIKAEHVDTFMKESQEIIEEELDIEINPISVEALGDISIKPAHITQLGWLLE